MADLYEKKSADFNELCRNRQKMPPPLSSLCGAEAPRATEPTAPDRNVAVGSHGEYVPTVTAAAAWCINAGVSLTIDLLTLRVVSESRVTKTKM